MCNKPLKFRPLNWWVGSSSERHVISPGIPSSASEIFLRTKSAESVSLIMSSTIMSTLKCAYSHFKKDGWIRWRGSLHTTVSYHAPSTALNHGGMVNTECSCLLWFELIMRQVFCCFCFLQILLLSFFHYFLLLCLSYLCVVVFQIVSFGFF